MRLDCSIHRSLVLVGRMGIALNPFWFISDCGKVALYVAAERICNASFWVSSKTVTEEEHACVINAKDIMERNSKLYRC